MALYDDFPYTNFHSLNLDWIIRKLKEIEEQQQNGDQNGAENSVQSLAAALSGNYPYTNFHALNLDWIVKSMTDLVAEWDSFSTNVSATAHSASDPEVTVSGDLKTGLNFDFGIVEGPQGPQGPAGPQGPQGTGLEILGVYATLADLQQAHPTGSAGDVYQVGSGGSYNLYVWNADTSSWQDAGSLSAAAPSDDDPLMDHNAAPGTSMNYSRADHVHPRDTSKQNLLISGVNIKTINSNSILGMGDLQVQEKLVSGTNIKTVNGLSLLGSGNVKTLDKYTAVYGTTTYANIFNAIANFNVVVCDRQSSRQHTIYDLVYYDDDKIVFSYTDDSVVRTVSVDSSNNWTEDAEALFSGNYNDLTNRPAIHSIPSGGNTGQVLTKTANNDYIVAWTDPSTGGGFKGIDTSNIILHVDNTNNSIIQQTYTATEDCYAAAVAAGSILFATVDGVPVTNNFAVIPLKAGQTLICALDGSRPSPYRDLTVYGLLS